ncbi:MAG: hypothetical protein KC800_30920, partial [Candidatus Eremiobacteraeota bacterium]|nr:hypothetical protein [Candidatus Eremiobacteraeota bacterium]
AVLTDESVSTLALEEDGSAVHGSQPGELQKLRQAVGHFSSTGELEPLKKARLNFQKRLSRVERRFQKMITAPGSPTEEQAAILQSARDGFSRALRTVREGLEMVVLGEETGEITRLEAGLQKLEEAHQAFENVRESHSKG